MSRGSERVEASQDADMSREPLTLVAQLPQLPQLGLVQCWPTAEENRHALITVLPRILKLIGIEQ